MREEDRQINSERVPPLPVPVKLGGSKGVADFRVAIQGSERPMFSPKLMEVICERGNLIITDQLKLKVNASKSAVAKPQGRKFLGFSFTGGKRSNRRKVAPESIKRFRAKVRRLTNRNHSYSFEVRVE